MRVTVSVKCDVCNDKFEFAGIDSVQLKLPTNGAVTVALRKQGWHFGRKSLCPHCYERYEEHGRCATCKNWRVENWEKPICKIDGAGTYGDDFCENYEKRGR